MSWLLREGEKKRKSGKLTRETITVCVKRQNGKGNAESPWPPACNLQSADGEARDEEVHSVHF